MRSVPNSVGTYCLRLSMWRLFLWHGQELPVANPHVDDVQVGVAVVVVEAHLQVPLQVAEEHLVSAVHVDGFRQVLPRPEEVARAADGLSDAVLAVAERAPEADEVAALLVAPQEGCVDDERFTLLVHLGYMAYDMTTQAVHIPNAEVRIEITEAVRGSKSHPELARWVRTSDQLLQATLAMDEDGVAKTIETIHNTKTAPTFYNNEQALRSVIRMAYIGAIDQYVQIQELPTGKGYADLVFIPRRGLRKPAIVVELKWNHPVHAAISQIHERDYPAAVRDFTEDILLVAITYDEKTKAHSCKIEKLKIED